ncbi:MAG: hypothetical protein MHMPM18_004377 [Marteilia pararefringens]
MEDNTVVVIENTDASLGPCPSCCKVDIRIAFYFALVLIGGVDILYTAYENDKFNSYLLPLVCIAAILLMDLIFLVVTLFKLFPLDPAREKLYHEFALGVYVVIALSGKHSSKHWAVTLIRSILYYMVYKTSTGKKQMNMASQ